VGVRNTDKGVSLKDERMKILKENKIKAPNGAFIKN